MMVRLISGSVDTGPGYTIVRVALRAQRLDDLPALIQWRGFTLAIAAVDSDDQGVIGRYECAYVPAKGGLTHE